MQQNFRSLKVLFPIDCDFDKIKGIKAKKPFDSEVCEFLNELSIAIREDKESRKYPDIITFGFFCRKANIENLKQKYNKDDRIGRGVSFHIAPSNVPINFAYTMVAGLLAGNVCVVKISSKYFKQTEIICRLLNSVNEKMNIKIENYISIIKYDNDFEITEYMSSISDIRVIWGGDDTVSNIKNIKCPSRCIDIAFADRYSLCILNAEYVTQINNWDKVAQDFYNDTYLYDQNACSSPRLMYWIGADEVIEEAKEIFWDNVIKYIYPMYELKPVIVVDKLVMDYRAAIELDNVKIIKYKNNLVDRIELKELPSDVTKYMCSGGSFMEYSSDNLDDLKKIVNNKFQTMSYLGLDSKKLVEWVINNGLKGVDRIVQMGKTMDFSLTWDGYDLIEIMTRKVYH